MASELPPPPTAGANTPSELEGTYNTELLLWVNGKKKVVTEADPGGEHSKLP